MRTTSVTVLTLALAGCAAPKDAARDSVGTPPPATPPAVVGDTAPGAAPMPNATAPPPSPAPPESAPTRKKPPTRVVPDPVLPPRDSAPPRP